MLVKGLHLWRPPQQTVNTVNIWLCFYLIYVIILPMGEMLLEDIATVNLWRSVDCWFSTRGRTRTLRSPIGGACRNSTDLLHMAFMFSYSQLCVWYSWCIFIHAVESDIPEINRQRWNLQHEKMSEDGPTFRTIPRSEWRTHSGNRCAENCRTSQSGVPHNVRQIHLEIRTEYVQLIFNHFQWDFE